MTADPYRYFRIEARELADQLGDGVRGLGRGVADRDEVARLLRLAHTLKGAARVVRQLDIAGAAHSIEDVLAPYRGSADPVPADAVARVAGLVDGVSDAVTVLPGPPGGAGTADRAQPDEPAPDAGGSAAAARPAAAATEIFTAVAAGAADVDALLESVGQARAEVSRLERGIGAVHRARRNVELVAQQVSAPARRGGEPDVAARDQLRALVAALGGDLSTLARTLVDAVERVDRELAEVRLRGERLGLVPVDTLFPPLRRAARDAADLAGKQVVVETDGGGVRLDPQLISAVYSALQHVVRNAVVHGVEPPPRRVAAGKPATGTITVTAQRLGPRVVFACRDDGAGFDLAALREAAVRGGTVDAVDARSLSDQQVIALALRGGVSTSPVNELAGRGVGLDVANEVSGRLRGELTVDTEPGRGTVVRLTVPSALAAVEAMTVDVDGRPVAVPLDAVRHCMPARDAAVARTAGGATVVYDGVAVPFVPLRALLSPGPGAGAGRTGATVVVLTAPGGAAAIGVDRVLGTAPVVVREVPPLAAADPVVGGLWLDPDGDPRIMLDPVVLVAVAGAASASAAAPGPAPSDEEGGRPGRRVLVVDDSLTTRMLERSILEAAGYDVEVAASGEEALDKAGHGDYGLFLVDIEMPGMDGFTFVERTLADPALREVPSILISSCASEEDRRRGARAGARMHLNKNEFDQNELLRHVKSLVR